MTTTKTLKVTVRSRVLAALPPVGGLVYAPRSDRAIKRIAFIRHRAGSQQASVGLERVKRADLPDGTTIPPWPRLAVGRPRSEAAPASGRQPQEIEPQARKARDQRRRVAALLADDRDADRAVHAVRVANATVVEGEWRDPADLAVNRRTPKTVKGFRTYDVVDHLASIKSINRKQARSARRLRDHYDRGIEGVRLGYDRLQQTPSGYGSGSGPSEMRELAYQEFEAARSAVGKSLYPILLFVVIGNSSLKAYCERVGCHHYVGHARLIAALDRLADHYEETDEASKRAS